MGRVIEEELPLPPKPPRRRRETPYVPPAEPTYHRGGIPPERLLGINDIARELGVTPGAVCHHRRQDVAWLPKASFLGPGGGGKGMGQPRELWRRRALVKAGVLPPTPTSTAEQA